MTEQPTEEQKNSATTASQARDRNEVNRGDLEAVVQDRKDQAEDRLASRAHEAELEEQRTSQPPEEVLARSDSALIRIHELSRKYPPALGILADFLATKVREAFPGLTTRQRQELTTVIYNVSRLQLGETLIQQLEEKKPTSELLPQLAQQLAMLHVPTTPGSPMPATPTSPGDSVTTSTTSSNSSTTTSTTSMPPLLEEQQPEPSVVIVAEEHPEEESDD